VAVVMMAAVPANAWEAMHTFTGSGIQSYNEQIPNPLHTRYHVKATITYGQAQSTVSLGLGSQLTATAHDGETVCQYAVLEPTGQSSIWTCNAMFTGSGIATCWAWDTECVKPWICNHGQDD